MIKLYSFHSRLILNNYSFFSIGKGEPYINKIQSERLFSSYKNSIRLLEKLLKEAEDSDGQVAMVLSGSFVDILQKKRPDIVVDIKKQAKGKKLILFATTYHQSLASLYSYVLFKHEIRIHQEQLKDVFAYESLYIYNPIAIYFDELSFIYKELGFKWAIAPASTWHLNKRPVNQTFFAKESNIKLLLSGNKEQKIEGLVEVIDAMNPAVKEEAYSSKIAETLECEAKENYFAPHPIKLKDISRSALQNSVIDKIKYLEHRIVELKKEELIAELSGFTSIDYFLALSGEDIRGKRPHDYYISMMNILSDFEIVHKLSAED